MEHNTPDKTLRVLQWNCRSINTTKDQLIQHLARSKYQILALQSLAVTPAQLPVIEGFHYPPYYVTDKNNKVKVATYIISGLSASREASPKNMAEDCYSLLTDIKVKNSNTIHLLNIYSPTRITSMEWLINLKEDWIVVGDFNKRDAIWENNYPISSPTVAEILQEADVILMNDGSPTRIPDQANQNMSAIDLTFISSNLAGIANWNPLEDSLDSDHLPIEIFLEVEASRQLPELINKFIYDKADWDKFQAILMASNTNLDPSKSLDEVNNEIAHEILRAAEQSIPKKGQGRDGARGHPWWTPECKKAVKVKRKAFIAFKHCSCNKCYTEMKDTKQNVKKVIAQAKLNYWNNTVDQKCSLAQAWEKVKILKGRYNPPEGSLCDPEGKPLHTVQQKAEGFLKQFAKVSRSANLPAEAKERRAEQFDKMDLSPPSGDDDPLTMFELSRALLSIKTTKSSAGSDRVTYPMLRHLPLSYKEKLLAFYNTCWEQGEVPRTWKRATVVPIPKPGKPRKQLSSFRPIALTSHISKVYERIMRSRLLHHIDRQHSLPRHQAGFRKGRSVTDHLVKLAEHIRRAKAKKQMLLTIFFDISRAFDTVWHAKLLHKLKNLGISQGLYRFVGSFLSDRSIAVRWKGHTTGSAGIDMGVPQGSVIAPLLFTIMIKNLGIGLQKGSVLTSYADDVALWRPMRNLRLHPGKIDRLTVKEMELFQKEANLIADQLRDNGFVLSTAKTVFMPVFQGGLRPAFPEESYHINIQGHDIPPSKTVKYLGVIFHRNGTWKDHINNVISNARRALGLIRMIRHETWGQNRNTLIHQTLSLIRSRLLFGSEVLHGISFRQVRELAVVECTALRLALGIGRSVPQRKVYCEAGVTPIWHQIKISAAKYIFRSSRVPNSIDEELDQNFTETWFLKKEPGIAQSVEDILQRGNIKVGDRHDVAQVPTPPQPPWTIEQPVVTASLGVTKKNDDPYALAAAAHEALESVYADTYKIYTDGSLFDDGTSGAGIFFHTGNISRSFKLSTSSVFTAEMVAILKALEEVNDRPSPPPKIAIFSDSRSALQAIQNGSTTQRPEILAEIQAILTCLNNRDIKVFFQWVPSHVGIRGNEKADSAAKTGAQSDTAPQIVLKPTHKDFYRKIESAGWIIWQEEYVKYASEHNWPVPICHPDRDALFTGCPSKLAQLMSRIRVNHWRTKFTKVKCVCGEPPSFSHVLFQCDDLRGHFTEIITILSAADAPLELGSIVNKEGGDGWALLALAAKLIYSSPVGVLM